MVTEIEFQAVFRSLVEQGIVSDCDVDWKGVQTALDAGKAAMVKGFPDPAMVPGVERYDEEGNDKTYEHETVTQYWLEHYVGSDSFCTLCKNTGKVRLKELNRPFCICPNGQAMRWHSSEVET